MSVFRRVNNPEVPEYLPVYDLQPGLVPGYPRGGVPGYLPEYKYKTKCGNRYPRGGVPGYRPEYDLYNQVWYPGTPEYIPSGYPGTHPSMAYTNSCGTLLHTRVYTLLNTTLGIFTLGGLLDKACRTVQRLPFSAHAVVVITQRVEHFHRRRSSFFNSDCANSPGMERSTPRFSASRRDTLDYSTKPQYTPPTTNRMHVFGDNSLWN